MAVQEVFANLQPFVESSAQALLLLALLLLCFHVFSSLLFAHWFGHLSSDTSKLSTTSPLRVKPCPRIPTLPQSLPEMGSWLIITPQWCVQRMVQFQQFQIPRWFYFATPWVRKGCHPGAVHLLPLLSFGALARSWFAGTTVAFLSLTIPNAPGPWTCEIMQKTERLFWKKLWATSLQPCWSDTVWESKLVWSSLSSILKKWEQWSFWTEPTVTRCRRHFSLSSDCHTWAVSSAAWFSGSWPEGMKTSWKWFAGSLNPLSASSFKWWQFSLAANLCKSFMAKIICSKHGSNIWVEFAQMPKAWRRSCVDSKIWMLTPLGTSCIR